MVSEALYRLSETNPDLSTTSQIEAWVISVLSDLPKCVYNRSPFSFVYLEQINNIRNAPYVVNLSTGQTSFLLCTHTVHYYEKSNRAKEY